jgi:AcrR family transcriptional regulator
MSLMSTATTRTRSTADERREAVLDAAMTEFAQHGYHAASTAAIAKRAGISQPYIYALFPDKQALFLACYRRACELIQRVFSAAARGTEPGEERMHAMGKAYVDLLERRDEMLVQLQAFAAAGDPELRPAVRKEFVHAMDHIRRLLGGSHEEAANFTATGMMLNIVATLEMPAEYWPKLEIATGDGPADTEAASA